MSVNATIQADLIREFPHLIPVTAWKGSRYALAAKNIKIELTRAFPGIKFRVTSQSYSMGCSVDVHWTDGPIVEKVQKIIDPYSDSTFDGMDDSTHYVPTDWTETFGSAKYVRGQRSESKELIIRAAARMGIRLVNADFEGGDIKFSAGVHPREMDIYREARGMELTDPMTGREEQVVLKPKAHNDAEDFAAEQGETTPPVPVVPIRTMPADEQFKAIAGMFIAPNDTTADLLKALKGIVWKLNHNHVTSAGKTEPAKIDRNDATVRDAVEAIARAEKVAP